VGRSERGHLEVDVEDPAEEGRASGPDAPFSITQQVLARRAMVVADVSSGNAPGTRR